MMAEGDDRVTCVTHPVLVLPICCRQRRPYHPGMEHSQRAPLPRRRRLLHRPSLGAQHCCLPEKPGLQPSSDTGVWGWLECGRWWTGGRGGGSGWEGSSRPAGVPPCLPLAPLPPPHPSVPPPYPAPLQTGQDTEGLFPVKTPPHPTLPHRTSTFPTANRSGH